MRALIKALHFLPVDYDIRFVINKSLEFINTFRFNIQQNVFQTLDKRMNKLNGLLAQYQSTY